LKANFTSCLVDPTELPVGAVLVDALQTLRKVDPGNRPVTGFGALKVFAGEVAKIMERGGPGLNVVGFCFDVSEHVPAAKGEEQSKRTAAVEKRTGDDDFVTPDVRTPYHELNDGAGPIYSLDELLPWDWEAILHDRRGPKGRKRLIAWICRQLCKGPAELPLPPNVRVYFFGHCFEELDCKILKLQRTRTFGESDVADVAEAPVVLARDCNGERVVDSAWGLRNRVGEAEFQFAFLHGRQLRDRRILLRSNDADVLYLALVNRMDALWSYEARQALDVRALSEQLRALKLPYEDPEWALAACAYAAGSDYTYPWGGLRHPHFMKAFFDPASRISPDLCVDGKVSADGFLDLLLAAFSRSRKGEYRLLGHAEARERGFAGDEFVTHRYLQLSYALALLKASAEPRLPDLDPLDFSYEKTESGALLKLAKGH